MRTTTRGRSANASVSPHEPQARQGKSPHPCAEPECAGERAAQNSLPQSPPFQKGVSQAREAPKIARRRLDLQIHVCRCRHKRSEEHTSELQSHSDLVCRLLLE